MPELIKGAETDRLLLSLIETSLAAIAVYTFDGNFLYVNQRALELHGYSREEFFRLNLRDITAPASMPNVNLYLEELKRHGTAICEFQRMRKDGTILPVQVFSKTGKWQDKDVILCISTDITQQKKIEQEKNALIKETTDEQQRSEEARRESEDRYQSLVENIPMAICTTDEKGNTIFMSEFVTKIVGFTPRDIIEDPKLWFGRIHEDDIKFVKEAYKDLFKHNKLFDIEYRMQHKNGSWIWLHDRASKVYTKGQKRFVDGVFWDITEHKHKEEEIRQYHDHLEELIKERTGELEMKTKTLAEEVAERKQSEEALRESEKTFRTLAESAPNMTFINQGGRIVFVNQRCIELMGYSQDEFYSPSFDFMTLVAPEDRDTIKKMFQRHSAGEEVPPTEYAVINKYGQRIEAIYGSRLITFRSRPAILGIITDITYRKRAEEAMRESEQTFRSLAESSPSMIFINQGGRIVYVNKRCTEMMEYSRDEFYDPRFEFLALIAPEYKDVIRKMFQQHITGAEVSSMEYALLTKSGKRIEAIYASRLITFQGKPAILGVVTDITERKLAEEALRENEAQLKDAQALGKIGSWEFDIVTQRIKWSDQTYRLYHRDPALGPPSPLEESEYYSSEQNRMLRESAYLAISVGKSFHYDLDARLKNGSVVYFSCTMQPVKNTLGQIVKLFGTVQDITERRLVEEKLRQTNQFLDTIIDNIPLIISVKDAHTFTYVRVNRTFEEQAKMVEEDIVGKTAGGLFTAEEAKDIATNDQEVIQSKRILQFEGRMTRTGRIYRTIKIPIANASGEVMYLLSIADDITDQLKIEQERKVLLEKALQISDYKSSLLSHTAHELKTPLTVIMGWGELFYNAKKSGKSIDATFDLEDFETILRNAERLNNLINDFLDVGAIDKGKFEINKQSLDFSEVIHSATRSLNYLALQKKIMITTKINPPSLISVDRRRMEQVVINLLSNAIKYSPENTTVTLQTSPVEITGHKMLRVEITDQGFGFTPQELAEAMTPFGKVNSQQEQKQAVQGTGLGLFISRQIIEQHGGTLVIRSDGINKGSQVEILLPFGE